ncbi:MAG: hypothetical protein FWG32_02760 [Oscillospiraceae bacterium]|nr:hypothetical protein [Oscillospiraceae bacterium]
MSNTENLNPETLLSIRIGRMSRSEALDLGMKLCEELAVYAGTGECHGGVRPDNISVEGEKVTLGPPARHNVELGSSELEYISPEQFWDNAKSPANDVYSLGLVLYAACNEGRLPFLGELGEYSPEDRANGLRRRMQGEAPYPPAAAGENFGAVIVKALSSDIKERFRSAEEMLAELRACPISEPPAVIVETVKTTAYPDGAFPETAPPIEYKVDKDFEPVDPQKQKIKKKEKPVTGLIIALILVVMAVAVIIMIMRGCDSGGPDPDIPEPTYPAVTSSPPVTANVPGANATPEPTPPEAVPTHDPSDFVEPRDIVKYEIVFADLGWEDAEERCRAMGGHLATPNSRAELDEITEAAEKAGAVLIWLGAYRAPGNVWTFVTGEVVEFFAWGRGEPSFRDIDGTPENFLLLWNVNVGGETGWRYNDCRADPAADFPNFYSGRMAFVCEYDIP